MPRPPPVLLFLAPLPFNSPTRFALVAKAPKTCAAPAAPPRPPPVFMAKSKRPRNYSPTIDNRVARSRYHFLEKHECGIELLGTEVKSIRLGQVNLRDSYAIIRHGQMYVKKLHISHYTFATPNFNHEPLREKRLLLHKRQIRKLQSKLADKGLTLVPTRLYFANGFVKLEIALAKGLQLADRREHIKKREDQREMKRIEKVVIRTM